MGVLITSTTLPGQPNGNIPGPKKAQPEQRIMWITDPEFISVWTIRSILLLDKVALQQHQTRKEKKFVKAKHYNLTHLI